MDMTSVPQVNEASAPEPQMPATAGHMPTPVLHKPFLSGLFDVAQYTNRERWILLIGIVLGIVLQKYVLTLLY